MLPDGFTEEALIEGKFEISPEYVRATWRQLSQEVRAELMDWGVDCWWERGFPYPERDVVRNRRDFASLAGLDVNSLLKPGNLIALHYAGSATCNSYHPERFLAESFASRNGEHSVIGGFHNRTYMRKCVRRCLAELGKLDAASLRYTLRTSGIQLPGNFRPSVAKWVYHNFCPRGGWILDPSAGWGGRALGAMALPELNYVGVDPHEAALKGNREMEGDLEGLTSTRCTFSLGCAEDLMPTMESESFDCIFTSPPYFDVEKYDDSPDQSHQKFPEYDQWKRDFLGVIIGEAARLLKPGGWFLLNVSEVVRNKYLLGQDVRDMAKRYFALTHTYYYSINPRANFSEEHRTRSEPIFLFRKIGDPPAYYPTCNPEIDSEDLRLF